MKKVLATIFGTAMILGIGAVGADAAGLCDLEGIANFGKMKGQMQEMHPEMNEKELQNMYEDCHGTGGAKPSKNYEDMSTGA